MLPLPASLRAAASSARASSAASSPSSRVSGFGAEQHLQRARRYAQKAMRFGLDANDGRNERVRRAGGRAFNFKLT